MGAAQRLRVGEWSVDSATNEISRGSERVHLEPKAVDLLMLLAHRPNEVVSREELLSQIWAGVVVGDDVLTQAVIKLRKALGDASGEPAYIQTIPKRGYRLIAPVSWPVPRPGPRRRLLWIAAACVVVAAAAFGWRLRPADSNAPLALSADAVKAARMDASPKVIVYPFREIAGDARQSLLARGFTSSLITDLGRSPDVRVIAPPASPWPREAERGSYVVTGDVQHSSGKIRLYVRLVDAASGEALWSEQYDRPYDDLLALQDELTEQVLGKLKIKVGHAELRRRAAPYTRNLQAYEHFLRAQAALIVRSKSGNELARGLYSKAIQLDPSFARARAGLALTYAADRRNNWTADAKAALTRATELAKAALHLDPESPEVLFAWAFVTMERGELSEAAGTLRSALRLNPSYADAYALLAGIQSYDGRPAETIPLIQVAMRLAPNSGYLYSLILGRAYFFMGDTDSAVLNLRQAVERNPESIESHLYLAAALARAGQRDAAGWEREEIRSLDPAFKLGEWLKNYPLADSRERRRLTEALAGLDL